MSKHVVPTPSAVETLYAEADDWHVNTGGQTIHAKRLSGRWRTLKWLTAAVWLIYFLGPYLRWNGQQAVLFDIPNRQYHLFSVTVLPQDFWMLSLLLLFFAILLAVVTALMGRVWCGYFCFQTVWTDIFTWIEERLEGPPAARRRLDQSPPTRAKLRLKAIKHALWILIGFLTGFSFVAWFTDAPTLWRTFFLGQAGSAAYATVALFTAGTYLLAGFLREQTCFWLCPYARIQGVMLDRTTIVPAYDERRGEPRGRVKRAASATEGSGGDCVDCNQCVAVCPTGIDIRNGQQEGCITCALCIDACDQVMEKVGRPRGLIRYASLDELEGRPTKPLLLRPRVWVYATIEILALAGIIYGLTSLAPIELKVLHERAPLFVLQSDGSIQNRYTLKILNKVHEPLAVRIGVSGHPEMTLVGADSPIVAEPGGVTPATVFVKIPRRALSEEQQTISFHAEATRPNGTRVQSDRESVFIGPLR